MNAIRFFGIVALLGGASLFMTGCERDDPYDGQPDGTIDRVERTERKDVDVDPGDLEIERTRSVEERDVDR
jgi:hypothetical protein